MRVVDTDRIIYDEDSWGSFAMEIQTNIIVMGIVDIDKDHLRWKYRHCQ
jgi:hypothetical protein